MAAEVGLNGLGGTPVGGQLAELTHNQGFDIGPLGFLIVGVAAHVSDMRIREAHNLPGITGIGENFLVAGEAGIEHNFACRLGSSTECFSREHRTIFEGEFCFQQSRRVNNRVEKLNPK